MKATTRALVLSSSLSFSVTLASGCDDPMDEAALAELDALEELDAEALDAEGLAELEELDDVEAGDSGDDEVGPWDPASDEPFADGFEAELDPSAAWVTGVGGSGGTEAVRTCPNGYSAIGVAGSGTGHFVRQLAMICGADATIEAGNPVPYSSQLILASGYYNPGDAGSGAGLVPVNVNWRPAWDASRHANGSARHQAPRTHYALCRTGYKVNKINVRAGSYVDQIAGVTCWWDGPGPALNNLYIYSQPLRVGGHGGSPDTATCQEQGSGGPFAKSIRFRSAYWLDGFDVNCGS